MVHAWLHARLDRSRSWELFREALKSDVEDVQGGTTKEGIHLGAMAGTVDLVQRCYTGIETRHDALTLSPAIPEELGELTFMIRYRGHMVHLWFTPERVTARVELDGVGPITIAMKDEVFEVHAGQTLEVPL
jgi:trehalose/maltose hydrolase-like predicted phosphorylase